MIEQLHLNDAAPKYAWISVWDNSDDAVFGL